MKIYRNFPTGFVSTPKLNFGVSIDIFALFCIIKTMIQTILAISEFATKLVAGLSGVVFGALILGLVVGAKNKKPKDINPEELKRKAKEQPVEEEKSSKKSKKPKADKQDKIDGKDKVEDATEANSKEQNDNQNTSENK